VLQFGVLTGVFAMVPDVDMVYAIAGLLASDPGGIWAATAAFWDSSRGVHRAMTHSIGLIVPAAIGFALAAGSRRTRLIAAGPLLGLVALGWFVNGCLAVAMLLLFVGTRVIVARLAPRWNAGPEVVLIAAYPTARAFDARSDRIHLPARFMFVFNLLFVVAFGVVWKVIEFGLSGTGVLLGSGSVLPGTDFGTPCSMSSSESSSRSGEQPI
jgi:hypothetical protein